MTAPLSARPAELRDAPAIAEIYNQGIEDRLATFETEPRTPEAVERLLADRAATYPAVLVENEHRVLGFAWTRASPDASGAVRAIRAFETFTTSPAMRAGEGGRLALAVLIKQAERRGFWKLVSRLFPENAASRRLCAARRAVAGRRPTPVARDVPYERLRRSTA